MVCNYRLGVILNCGAQYGIMHQVLKETQEKKMNIKEYIKNYKKVFLSACLFSLLCFCYMLVKPGISIDEETWIQIEKPFAM